MKLIPIIMVSALTICVCSCMTDAHHTKQNVQKILSAVNANYPANKNTLVFIHAPEGNISRYIDNAALENNVDTAKVVAIVGSLALKTNTVIVAGEDEKLTTATFAKALKLGMSQDNISGSKAIVIGIKDSQKILADLAAASGVLLEFIDNPI